MDDKELTAEDLIEDDDFRARVEESHAGPAERFELEDL